MTRTIYYVETEQNSFLRINQREARNFLGWRLNSDRLFKSITLYTKISYSSHMYGSPSKPVFSIIDLVHNAGIWCATFAFTTGEPESLYTETREPPLSLLWNLLLCRYTAYWGSQLSYPTYNTMFRPSLCAVRLQHSLLTCRYVPPATLVSCIVPHRNIHTPP